MQSSGSATSNNTIFKNTISTLDGQLLDVQLQGRQVRVYVSGTEVDELPEDLAKINEEIPFRIFLSTHEFCFSTHGNSRKLEVKKLDQETAKVYFRTQIENNPQVRFNYLALLRIMKPEKTIEIAGETWTGIQLLTKVVELNPRAALCWVQLGIECPNTGSIHIDGVDYNKRKLFIKAIETDKENSSAYIYLAYNLHRGGSIQIEGETWTRIQLLTMGVLLNPSSAWAWNELGIEAKDYFYLFVGGRNYSVKQLFIMAITTDSKYSSAYVNLAKDLPVGMSIEIADQTWTRTQLLQKVVELIPNQASWPWKQFGEECPKDGSINVGGKEYTKEELFIQAINLGDKSSKTYYDLAMATSAHRVIKNLFLVKAIENTPKKEEFCPAYDELLSILPPNGERVFILKDSKDKSKGNKIGRDGKEGWDKVDLLLEWTNTRMECADHLNDLGELLEIDELVTIYYRTNNDDDEREKMIVSKEELFKMAVNEGPHPVVSFNNLANYYSDPMYVVVGLEKYTHIQAYHLQEEAIEHNRASATAYSNAARYLLKHPNIKIEALDRIWSAEELCLKAIGLEPNCASAFSSLARTLERSDSITIPGIGEMTKRELLLRAIQLDPYLSEAYETLFAELQDDESIVIREKATTVDELCREMIKKHPSIPASYLGLARMLPLNGTLTLGENEWTKLQLMTKYLHLSPEGNPAVLNEIAKICEAADEPTSFTLPEEEIVPLIRSRKKKLSWTSKELYEATIELFPSYAQTYCNHANTLGIADSVYIDRKFLSKTSLYAHAIDLDEDCIEACQGLLDILNLSQQPSVTLGTRVITKEELLEKVSGSPPRKRIKLDEKK